MRSTVKLCVFLILCVFLFTSCYFPISIRRRNDSDSNTPTNTNTPANTSTPVNTNPGNTETSTTDSNQPETHATPEETASESVTLTFNELDETPNNGGKYYKMLSGTREVIITNLPLGKKVKLVRINPSNNVLNNIGTAGLFTVTDPSSSSRMSADTDSIRIEEMEPSFYYDSDIYYEESFEVPFVDDTDYEQLENEIDAYWRNDGRSARIVSSSQQKFSKGNTKTFNVMDDAKNWSSVSATLKQEGTYCYVWVADDNFDDSSIAKNDNKITSAQANYIAEAFDELYLKETALIGESYKNNPKPTVYIEPQNKISILIYDINHDHSQGQNGGTYGMFWGNDLYRKNNVEKSNEMELIYVDTHFTDKNPMTVISTVCHEFEHMLCFVNKWMMRSITNSETWFKEMGAMMAEDCLATYLSEKFPDSFSIQRDSTLNRLKDFNPDYYLSGLTYWSSDLDKKPSILTSYAMAGIFGCWLQRNYGGADLIKEIINNDKTNEESITDAIRACGYSDTFDDVFVKFALSFAQPDATNYTLKQSTSGNSNGDYALIAADPWDSVYKGKEMLYMGPCYVPEGYQGKMQTYGFWITGWDSEKYTGVKLVLSAVTGEENYIVITD